MTAGAPAAPKCERHVVSVGGYGVGVDQSSPATEKSERRTLKFYKADDELPAAAKEALSRRSEDDLRKAADRANRRS